MIAIRTEPVEQDGFFRQTGRSEEVALWWLGQAGFALRYRRLRALLDPYLSDYLARKYRGREFPHLRAMPSPLDPGEVHGLSMVLCSHRHGDHMDPDALPAIAASNPTCRFIVPRAEMQFALEMGLPETQLTGLDAGDSLPVAEDVSVEAVPAAHETLELDENGHHRYLGFILRLGRVSIYHSGDCVPYDGLAERLHEANIDVALLPVNGRADFRRARGIAGNLHWEEALLLCREAEVPLLIAHHFGMFAFNTADTTGRQSAGGRDTDFPRVIVPKPDTEYVLGASGAWCGEPQSANERTGAIERRSYQWHEM